LIEFRINNVNVNIIKLFFKLLIIIIFVNVILYKYNNFFSKKE
jgi:hypothetical protein